MINVNENSVWEEYVKSYNDAISFRYKRISNWDDIVDLCGKDRATGEGAEISAEAIEVMTPPVNEVNHVDLEDDDQGLEDIHIINDTAPNPPMDRMTLSFEDLLCATTQRLARKDEVSTNMKQNVVLIFISDESV
ncbi:hypothetical protein M0R45_018321 [Rubus argutus]|uniref:Uncharacterized protein n=1 Tax=Rubus argutus TaxID=59490 RepID=A0AAW1X249_RUBAR